MSRPAHDIFRLPLTPREAEVVAFRRDGASIGLIAATLGISTSRARQLIHAATRKIEQERAASSFADPLDCPIELLPIPVNRQRPLLAAGHAKLRDIAGLTDAELLHIPGVGRAAVNFLRSFCRDPAAENREP